VNLLSLENIAFAGIDFSDTTYHLAPHQANDVPAGLRESILKTGLLHPPILKKTLTNGFQIVCGRKRLLAARETLEIKTCDCLILAAETDELRTFSIILEETLTSRQLSPIELATFFNKISPYLSIQDAARKFLPRLGLAPQTYHIDRLLALLELEAPLIDGLHTGSLHESTARELTKLPDSDRLLLFEIIRLLRLSVGKQKKLVSACRELAIRHNATVKTVLASAELQDILHHPSANRSQKAAGIMIWLTKNLFPGLNEAEKNFKNFTRRLGLPKEMSLAHTPAFEKDAITLSITFKNKDELEKIWQQIKPILASFHPTLAL